MIRPASTGLARPARSRPRSLAVLALLAGSILLVVACAPGGGIRSSPSPAIGSAGSAAPVAAATPTATPTELTVFAAASLRDAFGELAHAYEAASPGVRLVLSFDASSALRAQLESGAAADVFASADVSNPQRLLDAGLAAGPGTVFAGNGLAIVTPLDDPAGIDDPYDLARPGVRIVAAGPEVPISRYAGQLIANLQAYRGAQAELPDAIERNTVSREDNARAVLAKIELGEGDGAIVYVTDARASVRVQIVPLPPGVDVRVDYAAVVLSGAVNPEAGRQFVDWLTGPAAQAILVRRGFLPVP